MNSGPLIDSWLRCPTCEYNLTGTVAAAEAGMGENRCPECGTVFDPDKLRAQLAGVPAPIAIWDDIEKSKSIVLRYVQMCLTTWFVPWRLPRMIPLFYHRQSLRVFRRITTILAFGSVVGLVLIGGLPDDIPIFDQLQGVVFFAVVMLGIWGCIVLCERLLGIVLAKAMTPDDFKHLKPKPEASNRWWGVVGFFRSFVLLSVACLNLMIIAVLLSKYYPHAKICRVLSLLADSVAYNASRISLGLVFWWWIALGMTIIRAPVSWGRRVGGVLFVPIAAAVAVAFFAGIIYISACVLTI